MLDVTHAAIAARFQLFPESLHVSKVDLVEWNGHLTDGVIPAKSVIIQHLQVQSALDHLLIRKTWNRNRHEATNTDISEPGCLLHYIFSSVCISHC